MKTFEEWFCYEIEEYPYDPSYAARHFQTEQEYIDADLAYRDDREKNLSRDAWRFQQKEIDQLKKENALLRKGYKDNGCVKSALQLLADLEKAKECIEFYGDKDNYFAEENSAKFFTINPDDCETVFYPHGIGLRSGGKRARQFLKDLTFEGK